MDIQQVVTQEGNYTRTANVESARTLFQNPRDNVQDNQVVDLVGLVSPDDRGGGRFAVDLSDTTTPDDGGHRCIVDDTNRRLKRINGKDYWDATKYGVSQSSTAEQNSAGIADILEEASALMVAAGTNPGLRTLNIALESDWQYDLAEPIMLLDGTGIVGGTNDPQAPSALLRQAGDFVNEPLIDFAAGVSTSKRYPTLMGLYLQGTTATLKHYIRMRGSNRARIINILGRGGCSGEGLICDDTNSNAVFQDLYFVQCMSETAVTYRGAVDIDGTDHNLLRIIGQVSDANTGDAYGSGFKCGVRLAGASITALNIRGELSQIGLVLDGLQKSNIGHVLCDRNQGGGTLLTGGTWENNIANQLLWANGRGSGSDGTYDAVTVANLAVDFGNVINGVVAGKSNGGSEFDRKVRYGVFQTGAIGANYPNTLAGIGGGWWTTGANN